MTRLIAAIVLCLILPLTAVAHAIGLEARLKAKTVFVEAFYDDGSAATTAIVVVHDQKGRVVAKGKTDVNGRWNFPAPMAGKYRIRVDAGVGHVAKRSITIPAESKSNGGSASPIISEGATREEFTGLMKWIMAGIGVAIIGLLALLLRWWFWMRRG